MLLMIHTSVRLVGGIDVMYGRFYLNLWINTDICEVSTLCFNWNHPNSGVCVVYSGIIWNNLVLSYIVWFILVMSSVVVYCLVWSEAQGHMWKVLQMKGKKVILHNKVMLAKITEEENKTKTRYCDIF